MWRDAPHALIGFHLTRNALTGFGDYGAIEYFAISADRFGDDFILIDIKSHEAKPRTYKCSLGRFAKLIYRCAAAAIHKISYALNE